MSPRLSALQGFLSPKNVPKGSRLLVPTRPTGFLCRRLEGALPRPCLSTSKSQKERWHEEGEGAGRSWLPRESRGALSAGGGPPGGELREGHVGRGCGPCRKAGVFLATSGCLCLGWWVSKLTLCSPPTLWIPHTHTHTRIHARTHSHMHMPSAHPAPRWLLHLVGLTLNNTKEPRAETPQLQSGAQRSLMAHSSG